MAMRVGTKFAIAAVGMMILAGCKAGTSTADSASSSPPRSSPIAPASPDLTGPPLLTPSAGLDGSPASSAPPASAPGPSIRTDWIAETVVDGVRMRSQPTTDDESTMYEPLLSTGTRLFVVNGPIAGSGYAWYQVLPLGGTVRDVAASGWVAAASRDGRRWLQDAILQCPSELFENFASLANIGGAGGLSCYGSSQLSFLAAIRSCDCSVMGPAPSPYWLAGPDPTGYRLDAPPWLEPAERVIQPAFHPDMQGVPVLTSGDVYQVTAHYDDPAAATCVPDDGFLDGPLGDPVAQIGRCRMTLVVTRLDTFSGIDPG
jgi:hypothetical protein